MPDMLFCTIDTEYGDVYRFESDHIAIDNLVLLAEHLCITPAVLLEHLVTTMFSERVVRPVLVAGYSQHTNSADLIRRLCTSTLLDPMQGIPRR